MKKINNHSEKIHISIRAGTQLQQTKHDQIIQNNVRHANTQESVFEVTHQCKTDKKLKRS